jgi:polysaccharide export outer membrane protein
MIRAIGWLLWWTYLWSSLPLQRCSLPQRQKRRKAAPVPPLPAKLRSNSIFHSPTTVVDSTSQVLWPIRNPRYPRVCGSNREAAFFAVRSNGDIPEMKTLLQFVEVVAAGLLTMQLVLACPAQEIAPSAVAVAEPSRPHTVAGESRSRDGLSTGVPASGETTQPGRADGTGDPALGGERHPLYRLTKSDTVEVSFTFSPEFNQSLTVQPDGFVALRGAGALLAEGLTIPALREAVTRAYAGTLHEPEITVTLKEFERPYILASGEVARPGKYELRGDLTVNEAVAIAGGLTQQARHSQVVLFRRVSPGVAEAQLVDLRKMLNGRDLREDLHLRPGDFVFVPQSRISKIRRYVPTSALSWYLNPLQF